MAYVGLGVEPTPVTIVPDPPPPPNRWEQNAGYQRPGDSYPVYRWQPPVAFNNPVASRSRAWGASRCGPAYRSSASTQCSACMQGLGAYYRTKATAPIPLSGMAATVLPIVGIGVVLGLGAIYYAHLPR